VWCLVTRRKGGNKRRRGGKGDKRGIRGRKGGTGRLYYDLFYFIFWNYSRGSTPNIH